MNIENMLIHNIETLREYGTVFDILRITKGLVNETYKVKTSKGNLIVQRMNQTIGSDRSEDYRTVAACLARSSLHIPRLVATLKEGPWSWKVSEYVEHDAHTSITEEVVRSAASYLGAAHRAMRNLDLVPSNPILGFHDTKAIFEKLRLVATDGTSEIRALARTILEEGSKSSFPIGVPQLIHGDPKIDNFLFRRTSKGVEAITLIDWDTLMVGNPAIDVGDMMRSFCRNDDGTFNMDRFSAAADGYRISSGSDYQDKEMLDATKLITLELAARFIIDWFEDRYFGWDNQKFASRKESNIATARKYVSYFENMP